MDAPLITAPVSTYPIQLTSAYVYESAVRRLNPRPEERAQTMDLGIRAISVARGGTNFTVVLGGAITVPFRDTAMLWIECAVAGEFVAERRTRKAALEAFASREGALILWPYLRAYFGNLGQLTGIGIPPIPIVDVLKMLGAASPVPPARSKPRPEALVARRPSGRTS